MRNLLMVLVFALSSAAAAKSKIRFTRYRSWNSRMYPVWKDGDVRFRDCWAGGEVAFDVKNDAPTLTGAKATFNIDIRFPQNQTVLPDGQVVWARNCTINGTQYREGEAVYPVQDQELNGVFPDGTPFNRISNRKSRYVFVWKAWGRYWQVADGPSSTLTIGTDNVPLGSYTMELVIYHCRGKDRFVPLGYASTTFSITDQVPFAVSLSQVNDINQADQTFIQNRAVAFTINLHDPSQYLSTADITFNWNFGDDSGTLISRERMVTHTYLTPGSFRPEVVLMASISNGCAEPTTAIPTVIPTTSTPADAPPAPVPTEDATDMAVIVPASEVIPTEVIPTEVIPTDASEVIPTDASEVIPTDDLSLAASEATANLATDTDTAAEAADAEAVTPEEGDAAAAAPAAEDPAATVDLAAGAAAEVDATAEDANAAAAEEAAVPAAEGAAALPVAPVTEEPDVAAADNDAAAAEEAAAAEADVPAVDAAASATPEVEGEEAIVDLAATILPEAPAAATVLPEAAAAATVIAPALELAAEGEAEAEVAAATEVAEAEAVAPVENAIVPVATEATAVEEAEPAAPAADAEAEIVNEVAASAVPAAINEVAIPAEGEVAAEMEVEAGTEAAQVALVLAKRQAPELEANNCMVYRTGSFSTPVNIIEGIESAEIIEVANVVTLTAEVEQNAVDLTITCQGSLPNEVCTVISDADCTTPVQTVCNAVTPSPECQMVLRQFFNDSGVFCINVSLTNDVSLAVASARVSVTVGSNTSIAGTVAMVLGAMVLVCAIGTIALTYRRFKPYRPLREDSAGTSVGSSVITSVPLLLWNLLSRQSAGESRPLLQGRVV